MAEPGDTPASDSAGLDLSTLTIWESLSLPIVSEYSCKHCSAPIRYEDWCRKEVARMGKRGNVHKVIYANTLDGLRCAIL
jgi:hypothetical protein